MANINNLGSCSTNTPSAKNPSQGYLKKQMSESIDNQTSAGKRELHSNQHPNNTSSTGSPSLLPRWFICCLWWAIPLVVALVAFDVLMYPDISLRNKFDPAAEAILHLDTTGMQPYDASNPELLNHFAGCTYQSTRDKTAVRLASFKASSLALNSHIISSLPPAFLHHNDSSPNTTINMILTTTSKTVQVRQSAVLLGSSYIDLARECAVHRAPFLQELTPCNQIARDAHDIPTKEKDTERAKQLREKASQCRETAASVNRADHAIAVANREFGALRNHTDGLLVLDIQTMKLAEEMQGWTYGDSEADDVDADDGDADDGDADEVESLGPNDTESQRRYLKQWFFENIAAAHGDNAENFHAIWMDCVFAD
ncbi:uncharacterized protein KY384_002861 [Bacidia gigantensis]|uniref:uncharacterized protein n=1 Tax=Bacidia gigantensis TaxID=2732470 RepID=UPI001D053166|nr:uncharacterized protein KY384_002861 [Bacidia gigantensis]KAG8532376.1 hypothetical protein KY384_002861 [Bacidia gigantensis]